MLVFVVFRNSYHFDWTQTRLTDITILLQLHELQYFMKKINTDYFEPTHELTKTNRADHETA